MAKQAGININLLKERRQQNKKRKLLVANIQVVAGVVLAVYLVVMVIVMGTNKAMDVQLSNLEDKIQDQELAIAKLKPIESMYNLVVNKYELFDQADAARVQADAKVAEVVDVLPEKTRTTSIELGEGSDGISVGIRAFSLYEAVTMLNILEDKIFEGTYDLIGISRLSRDETGEYSLEVRFGSGAVMEDDGQQS